MEIRKLERWKQIVKKKQSRDETRTALILKLFQVKLIRLSEVGAGVLGEKDFKTNHHLYVNPAEQSWGVNKWGRQQLKKEGFKLSCCSSVNCPFQQMETRPVVNKFRATLVVDETAVWRHGILSLGGFNKRAKEIGFV